MQTDRQQSGEAGGGGRKSFHRLPEDVRRRSLLEATLDCVAEEGLDGASLRRIAERAGVTAGLIRHYFASKEELVRAAYEHLVADLTAGAAEQVAAGGDDPHRRLGRFIAANFTAPNLSARKVSLWSTFIGRVRSEPGYAEIHREGYRDFLARLQALVAPVMEAEGRPADGETCHRYAVALNGLIDGLWLEGSIDPGLYDPRMLPGIALSAAEGVLRLAPGRLATDEGPEGAPDTDIVDDRS